MTTTGPSASTTYTAYASSSRTSWSAQNLLVASPPGQMQYVDGGLAGKLNT